MKSRELKRMLVRKERKGDVIVNLSDYYRRVKALNPTSAYVSVDVSMANYDEKARFGCVIHDHRAKLQCVFGTIERAETEDDAILIMNNKLFDAVAYQDEIDL